MDGRVDDGVARRVGFSFRTDVLVDEDIASEGAFVFYVCVYMCMWRWNRVIGGLFGV